MPSKRTNSPGSSLCCFTLADGRHCALPADPQCDGLCLSHFNAMNRSPSSKGPARHLPPLSGKHLYGADDLQVLANFPEAVHPQAISPEKATTMNYIGNTLIASLREMKAEALLKGTGPDWDAIRKLLEDCEIHPVPDS